MGQPFRKGFGLICNNAAFEIIGRSRVANKHLNLLFKTFILKVSSPCHRYPSLWLLFPNSIFFLLYVCEPRASSEKQGNRPVAVYHVVFTHIMLMCVRVCVRDLSQSHPITALIPSLGSLPIIPNFISMFPLSRFSYFSSLFVF